MPRIYSLYECVMSIIRWLVMQEVCRRFEFARHFESHLAQPPLFICACKRRLPMNTPLLLCYAVHVLYSQPIHLISLFPWKMKKELLRWNLNPQHTAYYADALPIELPRQLSWLGRIKAIQGKGNKSNLT